jgi:hypothetical protein
VFREQLERQYKELLEVRDLLVCRVSRVFRVLVFKDLLVPLLRVFRGYREHLEFKVMQVHLKVYKDYRVLLVVKGLLELPLKEYKEYRGYRGHLFRVFKDNLVRPRVYREYKV